MYVDAGVVHDVEMDFIHEFGKFCDGSLERTHVNYMCLKTKLDVLYDLGIFTESQFDMYNKSLSDVYFIVFKKGC